MFPCTGIVDVKALVVLKSIIRHVIDAFERKRRSTLVAFGRVVVDDVEDDFEAGVMETRHHFFEFLQDTKAIGGVTGIRCKESDAVIAPKVREALIQQVIIVDECVYGQQLDCGDAERT